jgi:predicted neuraminidase
MSWRVLFYAIGAFSLFSALLLAVQKFPEENEEEREEQVRFVDMLRMLGNPTVLTGPEGELYLFFVSVSLGGWSGSAINLIRSLDGGESWGRPVRLVSSPFINISTLVRAPPLWLEDGRILLPVYHEFLAKFSELLVVAPSGRVEGKVRIRSGRGLVQPWVVPLDKNRAVAFMRSTDESKPWIHRCVIGPSGATTPEALSLPNPDAAVAALRLSQGRMMICFNPSDSNRHDLGLAVSDDEGISWGRIESAEEVDVLPAGVEAAEFSYPWLSLGRDGHIRLSYTWHRLRIRFQELEFER